MVPKKGEIFVSLLSVYTSKRIRALQPKKKNSGL